jgi:hypothetical protein
MAFIDFTPGATAPFPRPGIGRSVAAVAPLSALEQAAVDIGAHDPLSSIREEGSLTGLLRSLFAIPRTAALADPKLEAIRRLAVVAHLGVDVELTREERRAQANGVSSGQMAMVFARFGRLTDFVPFSQNGRPSVRTA